MYRAIPTTQRKGTVVYRAIPTKQRKGTVVYRAIPTKQRKGTVKCITNITSGYSSTHMYTQCVNLRNRNSVMRHTCKQIKFTKTAHFELYHKWLIFKPRYVIRSMALRYWSGYQFNTKNRINFESVCSWYGHHNYKLLVLVDSVSVSAYYYQPQPPVQLWAAHSQCCALHHLPQFEQVHACPGNGTLRICVRVEVAVLGCPS